MSLPAGTIIATFSVHEIGNTYMYILCSKNLGASEIRGPCSIEHLEHAHQRACYSATLCLASGVFRFIYMNTSVHSEASFVKPGMQKASEFVFFVY
jgi:hypothetical protein